MHLPPPPPSPMGEPQKGVHSSRHAQLDTPNGIFAVITGYGFQGVVWLFRPFAQRVKIFPQRKAKMTAFTGSLIV